MKKEQKQLHQYEILQTRVSLHGTRMWQLPFSYLGLIGVILSFTIEEDMSDKVAWIFLGLTIVGLFLVWALYGAYEGYSRTTKAMNELEKSLNLKKYTKCHPSHFAPYFALMGIGILSCLTVIIVLKGTCF